MTIKQISRESKKQVELVRKVIREFGLPIVKGPKPKDYNMKDTARILKELEKRGRQKKAAKKTAKKTTV